MKRRMAAALLALGMVFSVSACKDSKDGGDSTRKKKKSSKSRVEEVEPTDDTSDATVPIGDISGDEGDPNADASGATTPASDTSETTAPTEDTTTTSETTEAQPVFERNGEYVVFGRYEQDGDTSNGPEPIEWVVLAEEDGRMLLISRYILDGVPYHTEYKDVTWETCSLRAWLNDDFYNSAFDAEEQSHILSTVISNPDNEYISVPGGNDTEDKLFLLSVDELLKYYEFNEWEESYHGNCQALITDLTPYAESKGVQRYVISDELYYGFSEPYESEGFESVGYTADVIGMSCAGWWLRSPGIQSNTATFVGGYGHAGWDCFDRVVDDDPGVRPVMYISTK